MNRFGMWLASFMQGRYGMDQFNRFLTAAAFVLIIADIFINWRLLDLLTVVVLIYLYCRMFSRNINARYRENQKFLQLTARLRSRKGGGSGGYYGGSGNGGNAGFGFARQKDKTHKILRCEGCGEKLRVPKGAGTIKIKCPHCGTQFTKKV